MITGDISLTDRGVRARGLHVLLSNTASFVEVLVFVHVKDPHNLLEYSPLLKNTRVRQVVLDKWLPLNEALLTWPRQEACEWPTQAPGGGRTSSDPAAGLHSSRNSLATSKRTGRQPGDSGTQIQDPQTLVSHFSSYTPRKCMPPSKPSAPTTSLVRVHSSSGSRFYSHVVLQNLKRNAQQLSGCPKEGRAFRTELAKLL